MIICTVLAGDILRAQADVWLVTEAVVLAVLVDHMQDIELRAW